MSQNWGRRRSWRALGSVQTRHFPRLPIVGAHMLFSCHLVQSIWALGSMPGLMNVSKETQLIVDTVGTLEPAAPGSRIWAVNLFRLPPPSCPVHPQQLNKLAMSSQARRSYRRPTPTWGFSYAQKQSLKERHGSTHSSLPAIQDASAVAEAQTWPWVNWLLIGIC